MAKLKKGQVSATRAYEIADSLKGNASAARKSGYMYLSGGEKLKGTKKSTYVPGFGIQDSEGMKKIGSDMLKRADINSSKADRIKQAADKAVNKAIGRDIPLPPSDKLF
jgi:hypothetical protein